MQLRLESLRPTDQVAAKHVSMSSGREVDQSLEFLRSKLKRSGVNVPRILGQDRSWTLSTNFTLSDICPKPPELPLASHSRQMSNIRTTTPKFSFWIHADLL
jgi:hypothetical protein